MAQPPSRCPGAFVEDAYVGVERQPVGPAAKAAPAHGRVGEVDEQMLDDPREHARLLAQVTRLSLVEGRRMEDEPAVLDVPLADPVKRPCSDVMPSSASTSGRHGSQIRYSEW